MMLFWTLVLCVLSEMFLSYTSFFGGWPIRNYLIMFAMFIIFLKWLQRGHGRIYINWLFVLILVFAFIGILFDYDELGKQEFWYQISRTLIMSSMIFILSYHVFSKNFDRLTIFAKVFVFAVCLSSVVAIMQSMGSDFFWLLRESIQASKAGDRIATEISYHTRAVGMAYNSVELGYQIGAAFAMAWWLRSQNKVLYSLVMLLLFFGALASEMRSTLLAIIFELVIFLWFSKAENIKKTHIYFSMLIIAAIFGIVMLLVGFGYYERVLEMDGSAYGKIALAYLGSAYIVEHFAGAGILWSTEYAEFRDENLWRVDGWSGAGDAAEHLPHNQFLDTGIMYGWIGLVLLVWMYFYMFKKLRQYSHYKIGVMLMALTVGYIVNSLFHNAGPFVGDPMCWYFFGIIGVFLSLAKSKYEGIACLK